jgi:hypothetical protein
VYVRAHTHARTRTRTHPRIQSACKHARVRACVRACTHACAQACLRSCVRACVLVQSKLGGRGQGWGVPPPQLSKIQKGYLQRMRDRSDMDPARKWGSRPPTNKSQHLHETPRFPPQASPYYTKPRQSNDQPVSSPQGKVTTTTGSATGRQQPTQGPAPPTFKAGPTVPLSAT